MPKPIKATPELKAEVWSWYQKKRELGTMKSLARRLGISPDYVEMLIYNRVKQERQARETV